MDLFLNYMASGLIIGSIYGLIAVGFAIIFRATGVLNFAQGEVMMLVTYVSWSLSTSWALPFWLLMITTIAASLLIGAVLERVFIRPMLGQPTFAIIMVTIGLAIVLRSLTVLIWGTDAEPFETSIKGGVITLGPVVMYSEQLSAILLFVLVIASVTLFYRFTRVGVAMRAMAEDETSALLMGIDVKKVSMMAWAIAAAISGLAGVTFAMISSRAPDMWFLGLRSFPGAILGGLDSVVGAGIGGILIGVTGDLSEGYIGHGLKEISGFLAIIVILMVRPYGLFGQRELERV
jgi:branched-chain amino acid transport system permease protein